MALWIRFVSRVWSGLGPSLTIALSTASLQPSSSSMQSRTLSANSSSTDEVLTDTGIIEQRRKLCHIRRYVFSPNRWAAPRNGSRQLSQVRTPVSGFILFASLYQPQSGSPVSPPLYGAGHTCQGLRGSLLSTFVRYPMLLFPCKGGVEDALDLPPVIVPG